MLCATLAMSATGLLVEDVRVQFYTALTVFLSMLIAFSMVLRPIVAKVNAFSLIQTSLGISIGGATFYFYTDGVSEYPEGPHFSIPFFTTVLGMVGSVCSLIGIVIYKTYMREWTYLLAAHREPADLGVLPL